MNKISKSKMCQEYLCFGSAIIISLPRYHIYAYSLVPPFTVSTAARFSLSTQAALNDIANVSVCQVVLPAKVPQREGEGEVRSTV